MTTRYRIDCQCGKSVSVELHQAGGTVRCACGTTIDVPTLRDLRQLPQEPLEPEGGAKHGWSLGRGLMFSGGIVLFLAASIAFAMALNERMRLDLSRPPIEFAAGVDELTPSDAWKVWSRFLAMDLDERSTPRHILNRRFACRLNWFLVISGGIAVLGVILSIVPLAVGRGKRETNRRNTPSPPRRSQLSS